MSYKQYRQLHVGILSFGWTTPWLWPQTAFQLETFISKKVLSKSLKAIGQSDIFIAVVPGTASTNIEIGAAFALCEEIFLVSKDPIHFTQTGLCDAHLSVLPGAKRVCCNIEEIPDFLRKEFLHLVCAAIA